jgi:hypothetical protein
MVLKDCTTIRLGRPYSAALLPASSLGPEQVVIWYQVPGANTLCGPPYVRLEGRLCTTSPLSCSSFPLTTTRDGSNAFMPVVKTFTWIDRAFFFPRVTEDWHVSHWSDLDQPVGRIPE